MQDNTAIDVENRITEIQDLEFRIGTTRTDILQLDKRHDGGLQPLGGCLQRRGMLICCAGVLLPACHGSAAQVWWMWKFSAVRP